MSLYCDGDRCNNKDFSTFYCEDCYVSLQSEVEDLKNDIERLKEELRNIEQKE